MIEPVFGSVLVKSQRLDKLSPSRENNPNVSINLVLREKNVAPHVRCGWL